MMKVSQSMNQSLTYRCEGRSWDDLIPTLLNAADAYHLKIALHIEPYKNRSIETVSDDIKYIIDTYANHNAFYRRWQRYNRTMLPMIYVS